MFSAIDTHISVYVQQSNPDPFRPSLTGTSLLPQCFHHLHCDNEDDRWKVLKIEGMPAHLITTDDSIDGVSAHMFSKPCFQQCTASKTAHFTCRVSNHKVESQDKHICQMLDETRKGQQWTTQWCKQSPKFTK